jgi:uncharacterized protein
VSRPLPGAIDCDVHPSVPSIQALFPYLDDYWRDMAEVRGIDGFESRSYPAAAAISARPDWRGADGRGGLSLEALQSQLFDRWQNDVVILNCLYGVQMVLDEHMAAAFSRALNDWVRAEWLERDPRLRASIIVSLRNPARAVEEIERVAADSRFVQVLLVAGEDMPLGRSPLWPVYEAAVRHRLPIGIHAGSTYRHAPSASGWPSHHVEDYVANAQTFQAQLASLIAEGVFAKFPELKVVLLESGVTWLPAFLWRYSKFWRGLRNEIPWVDRPPAEIVRQHVRLTLQPLDAPPTVADMERWLSHLGSDDMLLYSSDYPHWHFDGDDAVPDGLPPRLLERVCVVNPRATYSRLGDRP